MKYEKRIIIGALFLFALQYLTGCATYREMSPYEKAWQGLHVVDVAQTANAGPDPCFGENNWATRSVIGQHPSQGTVAVWGVASSLFHATIYNWVDSTHKLPRWAKISVRVLDLGFKANTIIKNHDMGIRPFGENQHPMVDLCDALRRGE